MKFNLNDHMPAIDSIPQFSEAPSDLEAQNSSLYNL